MNICGSSDTPVSRRRSLEKFLQIFRNYCFLLYGILIKSNHKYSRYLYRVVSFAKQKQLATHLNPLLPLTSTQILKFLECSKAKMVHC